MWNDTFFGVAINIYGHNDYKRTQQAVGEPKSDESIQ